VIDRDGETPGLASMAGDDLRRLALSGGVLTATEIVELFEQWRYGRGIGLTIAIFTKRPKKPHVNFAAQVDAAIQADLDEDASKATRSLAPTLIGEDRFDDDNVLELPFKYGRQLHYLDMQERPAAVTTIRFGFAWVSARDQFVAITGHAGVVRQFLSAIAQVIGTQPTRVSFDKTTLDKNFDLAKVTSILQQDLERGIRTRVSGEELYKDEKRLAEILVRDQESLRLGARYHEDLPGGGHVEVGVNAPRSRMHTTRGLSSSDLRKWAVPRITDIVRSLLELQRSDPIAFYRLCSGAPLPGVPAVHADLVRYLAAGVALGRERGLDLVPLQVAPDALGGLPEDAGRLVARASCAACADNVLAMCDVCLDHRVRREGDAVVCASDHTSVLTCNAGHPLRQDELLDGVVYEPDRKLLEWVSAGLGDMRQEAFDPSREHFWVRANDLAYVRKPIPPSANYAVLYMDIEDSTVLQRKRRVFALLLRLTRHALGAATKAHGGRLANDTGDGGFALFPDAKSAVGAARAIQEEVASSPLNEVGAHVRIGIANGYIDTTGRNFEGTAINLAARLQDKARKGSRIAVDTKTAFAIRPRPTSELGRVRSLKGFEDESNDESYFLVNEDSYALQQKKGA
jgi:class 3 adenylate cyclase